MSSLSTYLKGKLSDLVLRNTAYTAPNPIYVCLHTANPTVAGNVGEVDISSGKWTTYARQAITFSAISGATIATNATVTFPAFTGTDQTVTHWSINDSATHSAGNCLLFGALTASKLLQATDVPSFPTGSLQITWN